MKRWHLLEIEDQPWCPAIIRDSVTDCLQFVVTVTRAYAPIVARLGRALETSGSRHILDLCSGGGGPWPWLQPALAQSGLRVSVHLTDQFPNLIAFQRVSRQSAGSITFEAQAVDAAAVPPHLGGLRTLFNAFHHFDPARACAVLHDAVRQHRAIAIFEVTRRQPLALLQMLLFPLAVLLVTPCLRPFRWSRLGWTYLLPVVPLVTLVDGLVSCLRCYSVAELRQIIAQLDGADYHWEVGVARGRLLSPPITYLIGSPIP